MKRPLCVLALIVTAVVYLYLEFFSSVNAGDDTALGFSGRYVEVVGRVQNKEFKKSFDGGYLPVIYIVPTGENAAEFEKIQCYLESPDRPLPSIGQFVMVGGKAKPFSSPTNPGEFDSRLYYSTLKISYRISDASVLRVGGKANRYREDLFELRLFFEKALDKCLDERDAGVMKAMLLGDKAFMDEEVKDSYKSSGIMHVLAVSGLHISIIGMGLYELLRRICMKAVKGVFGAVGNLSNRTQISAVKIVPAVISILFMYSYGVMCGMGSSSFRAICMFALRMTAPLFGRTYDVLSALALSEMLLLLDQPLYLYNSGFLFSFGAVIGIAVVSPVIKPFFLGDREGKMVFVEEDVGWNRKFFSGICTVLGKGIVSGISIALVTLPVYALFYYTYPVHSLVLNLMVVPLMGILMTLGIVTMLLAAVWGILGIMPGFLVHIILAFYSIISSSGTLTGGFTWCMGHSEKWQVAVYLALLTVFVVVSGKGTDGAHRILGLWKRLCDRGQNDIGMQRNILPDLMRYGLLIAGVLLLTFHNRSGLEIDFIDVGQGDGIVISCDGKNMLIDGGSTSKSNVGKYQIMPFLKYKGIGRLEAVVVTHEDQDHVSGILELFDDMEDGGIHVESLIMPEVADSSRGDNYHLLEKRASELGIPVLYINSGESFGLGEVSFTCFNPELGMEVTEANAYSTVLFMEYGEFTALFTGDVEGEGLEYVKWQLKEHRKEMEIARDTGGEDIQSTGDAYIQSKGVEDAYTGINLLKVAHHGSQYTTDEEFLNLVRPQIAVISCGRNNSYGHPHEELLERLEDASSEVYRTDQSGELEFAIKNRDLRIKVFME
jgi:competence protein ComEC